MYGRTTHRFPATMRLVDNGAVSDALVCARRWTDLEVQMELRELLGVGTQCPSGTA